MTSRAKTWAAALAAGATVLAGLAMAPSATADQGNRSTYLVQTARGASNAAAERALTAAGGTVTARWTAALQGFAVELPDAAVAGLSRNPTIGSIEADGIAYAVTTESPVPSWGLDRLDQKDLPLDGGYTYDTAGANVDVYVIDTGILADHSEFGTRVDKANSRNFVGKGRSVDPAAWNDCNGHGTHVAGTIGGTTTGVAKAVTLHAVRVLDCRGSGSWSGVINGIEWVAGEAVAAKETVVANMSLGGSKSDTINAAVEGAVGKGVVMAVAAGNESTDACSKSPASAPSAITVGATTSSDVQASYSNFGTCVDIYAPGSGIYSSWNDGGYNTISGTSMATPHVAGAAARYVGAHSGVKAVDVAAALTTGAVGGHVTSIGVGSPNALLNTQFLDGSGGGGSDPAPLTITSSSLPGASVGTSYSVTLTATGGTQPYTWSLLSGSLPDGLFLSPNGLISGEPKTQEAPAFTVRVEDGVRTDTAILSIAVGPQPSITAPSAPTLNNPSWGRRNAQFSWNPPANTGGAGISITSYHYVMTGPSGIIGEGNTSGTGLTLKFYSSKAAYTLAVSATNSAGLTGEAATGTWTAP